MKKQKEDYGTKVLKRVLKRVSNYSTEDYEKLFTEAQETYDLINNQSTKLSWINIDFLNIPVFKELIGTPISRKEAIKIAKDIGEEAEKERKTFYG